VHHDVIKIVLSCSLRSGRGTLEPLTCSSHAAQQDPLSASSSSQAGMTLAPVEPEPASPQSLNTSTTPGQARTNAAPSPPPPPRVEFKSGDYLVQVRGTGVVTLPVKVGCFCCG
jgi:hypothetical protein